MRRHVRGVQIERTIRCAAEPTSQIPGKEYDAIHWKHLSVLIIGVLTALTAYGPRPAYGAPPSDSCSLLTLNQVSAVLGGKSKAGALRPHYANGLFRGESPSIRQKKGAVSILTPAAAGRFFLAISVCGFPLDQSQAIDQVQAPK